MPLGYLPKFELPSASSKTSSEFGMSVTQHVFQTTAIDIQLKMCEIKCLLPNTMMSHTYDRRLCPKGKAREEESGTRLQGYLEHNRAHF